MFEVWVGITVLAMLALLIGMMGFMLFTMFTESGLLGKIVAVVVFVWVFFGAMSIAVGG